MVKLKKKDMKIYGCIYCKYYSSWMCSLDRCILKTEAIVEQDKKEKQQSKEPFCKKP